MKTRLAALLVVAAVAAFGLVMGSPAAPAWACSCAVADPDGWAASIVVGTVTDVDEHGIELTVESVEKGDGEVGRTLRLRVGRNEASCGYPFHHGQRYRVPSRAGATSLCSGIRPVAAAQPPVRPADAMDGAGDDDGAPSRWVVAGGLGLLAGLGLLGGLGAVVVLRGRGTGR